MLNESLDRLLEFADAYVELSEEVHDDFRELLSGNYSAIKYDSVKLIDRNLGNMHEDIDSAIDHYYQWYEEFYS